MDSDALALALAGLPLGPQRFYETIGSTNSEAAQWANTGAPDLALVVADEQTSGRGRHGRTWFTPPKAALAFSLVLRNLPHAESTLTADQPRAMAPLLARLTGMAALAVAQALEDEYGLAAQIKWPNDVLLPIPQEPGAGKVAGILAEAHWQGDCLSAIVMGIGVNIKPQAIPTGDGLVFPATCVETVLKSPIERLALLRAILVRLLNWRERLNTPDLLEEWQSRLAYRGKWVEIYTETSDTAAPAYQGILLGLDEQGRLELHTRTAETIRLQIGEIRLRPGRDV